MVEEITFTTTTRNVETTSTNSSVMKKSTATATTTTSISSSSSNNNSSRKLAKDTSSPSSSLELSLGCVDSARSILASLQANPLCAHNITDVVIRDSNHTTSWMGTRSTASNSSSFRSEVVHLLGSVGALCPRLETLRIAFDTSTGPHYTSGSPLVLPVAALTAFFEQAHNKHFVSLRISSLISADDDGDFVKLGDAIRQHAPSSWNDVRLEFCEPAPGTPSLDPLLLALSAAPQLEQVTLSGTNITHGGVCTGPSLVKLVQHRSSSSRSSNGSATTTVCSSRLKTLTIWGGKRHLQAADICSLLQSLETNTSLRELTIHARGTTPDVGRALARCLSANTTIERLILNVSDNNNHHVSRNHQATALTGTSSSSTSTSRACTTSSSSTSSTTSDYVTTTTLLAKALQHHNRTLRLLSLDHCPDDEDSDGVLPGDSLDHDFFEYHLLDRSNKELSMRKNVQAVSRAFTEMLHCNPVLEVLWMNLGDQAEEEDSNREVDDEDDDDADGHPSSAIVTSEMDMLLRLNRYGIRQRLFEKDETFNGNDWIDAVASQSYDLNAVYYLISKNPSLCCSFLAKKKKKRSGSLSLCRSSKCTCSTEASPPSRPIKRQRTTAC